MPNTSSSNKIGMDSRMEAVLSLLCIASHDVHMVGIWGMAGIGKTTLAEAIYQEIHTQFEGYCFLSKVREKSQSKQNLKKELLSKILQDEDLDISDSNIGSEFIRKTLHSKQVLIVLDDVNHIKQLEELAGHHDWFGPKSRIIITTRDKRLLIQKDVDAIYEAKELQNEEACTLFYQHAFKEKHLVEDFKELCDHFLDYAKGNPLAIRILGCLLYRRSKNEWDCELEKLKKFPNKDILEVLRIGFDGLEDTVKNIFLDIACFFKEEDKDYVSELLKCCDFYPETGITILVERALITISDDNKLCMHDLVQEMGREIVRQESIDFPGKRSRLWLKDDVEHVLETNSGTETIQGIVLDLSACEELDFNVDFFAKMIKLRVLEFRIFEKCPYSFGNRKPLAPNEMDLNGDFKFPSKSLRYLRWEGYPLQSLPSNFDPRKLFELNMSYSRLEQLWEGNKSLRNLGHMDLSHSLDLIKIPDLSGAPELKKINLEGCKSLVEIHFSIETLEKLRFLNLRYCSKLEKVAKSFCKLTALESVDFSGCSKLRKLPNDLRMSSPCLDLSGCSSLEELPKSVGELTSTKTLNLHGCSKLKKLPDEIGRSLVTLDLGYCSRLEELPKCIGELTSLTTLNLRSCYELQKLPDDIGRSLVTLDLSRCFELEELPKGIGELTSLKILELSNCSKLRKLSDEVGRLQRLEELVALGSKIQEVPHSISLLTRLEELSLDFEGSSTNLNLSFLGGFKNLKRLTLRDCNLQEMGDISSLCLLRYLDLSGSSFISLPRLTPLTQLSKLRIENCKSIRALTELPWSIETVAACGCESLETFLHPPNSFANSNSSKLEFDFSNCGRLLKNEENLKAILGGIQILPLFHDYGSFGALFTGRCVPAWFIHRMEGDSIIVKLPPDFHDLKAVGLGFCVVLPPVKRKPSTWHSPHLWFGYESGLTISDETLSKRVSHLMFTFICLPTTMKVKQCGIRLLY